MSAEPGKPPASPQPQRRRIGWWWIAFLLALLAINYWAGSRATQAQSRVRVPYSPYFLQQVTKGDVAEITSKGTAIQGTFKKAESYQGSKATTRFQTEVPEFADTVALSRLLEQKSVVVNAVPLDTGAPWWESVLVGFGPTLLFVGLLFLLLRRGSGMQSVLGAFGRSQARRYEPSADRVTFADVAGIDEAKAELSEVVDFLRKPDKYVRLGGHIPHGVLLAGPPGTGKTLLARAVAGEANAPFFSMSASELVEAIVGVGAARVRDLFAKAKESAPAIVFIDELDAIGRSRTSGVAGFSGGNDERPGRFDRRVSVQRLTARGARRSWRCTRGTCRLRRTSTSVASPRPRREWSARISRTSSTRRRCSPRGRTTRRSTSPTSPTRWSGSCSARNGRSLVALGGLDSLADALLQHETLDEDDAYAAAGVDHATTNDVGVIHSLVDPQPQEA